MTAPVRPSLEEIVARVDRPSLDDIVASAEPLEKLHKEFQSGHLAKRVALKNSVDKQEAAADEERQNAQRNSAVLGALAAPLSEVPGGKMLQAGVGKMMGAGSYKDALDALEGSIASAPAAARIPAKLVGGLASTALMPGMGPAAQGAIYGGASGLLDANPDAGIGKRALEAGGGAVLGAALGKGAEIAGTVAKAVLPKALGGAPKLAENMTGRFKERARLAGELYDAALQGAKGKEVPPEVYEFLSEPDVQEVVKGLQQTRAFRDTPADSPEMLDAIYKTFSDRVGQLTKGLANPMPNRPNIGRFEKGDLQSAQQQLLDAISSPSTIREAGPTGAVTAREIPAMMPGYATAKGNYAVDSKAMDALRKGADALYASQHAQAPTMKNLVQRSPEGFLDYLNALPSEERYLMGKSAQEGVLGQLQRELHPLSPFKSLKAAAKAAPLEKAAGRTVQAAQGKASPTFRDILESVLATSGYTP